MLATFLASSPRGVVFPFGLGGGGLGPDGLAFGFAFGAGAAFRSSFLVVFFGCGLPPPPWTLILRRGLRFRIRGWCRSTSDFVIGGSSTGTGVTLCRL